MGKHASTKQEARERKRERNRVAARISRKRKAYKQKLHDAYLKNILQLIRENDDIYLFRHKIKCLSETLRRDVACIDEMASTPKLSFLGATPTPRQKLSFLNAIMC